MTAISYLPPMPIVVASLDIQAPQDKLFNLSQDYQLRLRWDPFLQGLKFLDGATQTAVGVRVWVKAKNGLTMEVVHITVQAPEVVAMRMIRGPFYFESFAGSWRFKALGPNLTSVTFRYHFSTRFRLLRPVLDPLIHRVFLHDIRARLRGLKTSAETTNILEAL